MSIRHVFEVHITTWKHSKPTSSNHLASLSCHAPLCAPRADADTADSPDLYTCRISQILNAGPRQSAPMATCRCPNQVRGGQLPIAMKPSEADTSSKLYGQDVARWTRVATWLSQGVPKA
ncbi:hypothetical protein AMTR_s00013p00255450 [Amborella trichopoda]|uniref:Uncharacterized protein n=1 Tax=Amborella trichopoda TaxID=13333 RepID=W1PJ94_AMBTC|nr:hypothetical protein AMTR_s00013p00255450 [Amborella trichopoda]